MAAPFLGRFYYRLNKSGVVFSVREGVSVCMFANRRRLSLASHLAGLATQIREARIGLVGAAA